MRTRGLLPAADVGVELVERCEVEVVEDVKSSSSSSSLSLAQDDTPLLLLLSSSVQTKAAAQVKRCLQARVDFFSTGVIQARTSSDRGELQSAGSIVGSMAAHAARIDGSGLMGCDAVKEAWTGLRRKAMCVLQVILNYAVWGGPLRPFGAVAFDPPSFGALGSVCGRVPLRPLIGPIG